MLDGERGNLSLRPSNQMKRNSRPTHIAGGSLRVYRENDANAANGVASAVGGAVSLEETPYPRARTTSNWRARCSLCLGRKYWSSLGLLPLSNYPNVFLLLFFVSVKTRSSRTFGEKARAQAGCTWQRRREWFKRRLGARAREWPAVG